MITELFLSKIGFIYKDVDVTLYEKEGGHEEFLLVIKSEDERRTQRIKGKKRAYLEWETLHYHYHSHDKDFYQEPPF